MKKSSMKKQEGRINNGLFFLNFPPNAERYDHIFFLSCESMYFPFSYSFLFSCHFQEMALLNERYIYIYIYICVTFQPGPGRRGGSALPPVQRCRAPSETEPGSPGHRGPPCICAWTRGCCAMVRSWSCLPGG